MKAADRLVLSSEREQFVRSFPRNGTERGGLSGPSFGTERNEKGTVFRYFLQNGMEMDRFARSGTEREQFVRSYL